MDANAPIGLVVRMLVDRSWEESVRQVVHEGRPRVMMSPMADKKAFMAWPVLQLPSHQHVTITRMIKPATPLG
jgi:hypothetical protein